MEFSKIWKPDNLDGIELLSASFQKFEFSRHWHDELAVGIIEHGAEGLFYRGENIIVPQKHVVCINPGEIHTGFAGSDQGWTYRMFYFDPELIRTFFDKDEMLLEPTIDQAILSDGDIFEELVRLHIALEGNTFEIAKQTLLTQAFDKLFRRYGQLPKHKLRETTDQFAAKVARQYLHDHWQENISLDELEPITGVSKFQLIRSFKACYGFTPHQYLILLKIQRARYMLQQGESCVDTSLSCGFFDQSHFSRNFKKVYGVTPGNYIPR
ncbi:AraC family transcriptional regulator [Vibrio sonorensis]|uniref:AraC family transcriptional regulator n=1 Tax=Vibrio sonorensis TaxID=1004316 RepID=UPI0008DAB0A4|nr:AraC family transcriptional regulator [Vibrio sonorensis]